MTEYIDRLVKSDRDSGTRHIGTTMAAAETKPALAHDGSWIEYYRTLNEGCEKFAGEVKQFRR